MTTNIEVYRAELRESYVFDILISATSEDDAKKQVKAFYKTHRKPEDAYVRDGFVAILQRGQAKVRPPARDRHRDAASTA